MNTLELRVHAPPKPTQIFNLFVEDAFVWTGSIREAPEWVMDLIADGEAWQMKRFKSLTIKFKNGFVTADPNDIVIRVHEDNYTVIHANKNI